MDKRTFSIARFEFRRFLDVKGELISLAVLLLIAAVRFGGDVLMHLGAAREAKTVVVESATVSARSALTKNGIRYEWSEPAKRPEVMRRLQEGKIDGVVVPRDADWRSLELRVRASPPWMSDLQAGFAAVRLRGLAERLDLDAAEMAAIGAAPAFTTVVTADDARGDPRVVYGTAVAFMVMIIMGIMSSLNVILQGIVGERFGRICEMVLSALPARTWIDGKLIAATLHGVKTTLLYSLYGAAAAVLMGLVSVQELQALLGDLPVLAVSLFVTALGLVFWNCGFAAIAALMPTPHSPIRNTFVFVPMTMLLLVLSGTKVPENPFMQFLAVFPLTSPFALPVRLVYGMAGFGEIVAAVAALAVSTIVLRSMCIRIFEAAALGGGAGRSLRSALARERRGDVAPASNG